MLKLKIFTKPDCPKCPPAKKLGTELSKELKDKLTVEWYDTSDIDGLTEATFYSVQATPSMILTDEDGSELKSWRGEAPLKISVLQEIPEE